VISNDIDDHIWYLISIIKHANVEIAGYLKEHMLTSNFFVYWYSRRISDGPTLSVSIMEAMVKINAEISIDIYYPTE
jgi:hypothetical protein